MMGLVENLPKKSFKTKIKGKKVVASDGTILNFSLNFLLQFSTKLNKIVYQIKAIDSLYTYLSIICRENLNLWNNS